MRRARVDLDYQALHKSGKKITKVQNLAAELEEAEKVVTETIMTDSKDALIHQISLVISTLEDDIDDYIDENDPTDGSLSVQDIDGIIDKVGQLRSSYRSSVKELQRLSKDEKLEVDSEKKLQQIKDFINAPQACWLDAASHL